jgi:hypothetical protein
VTCAAADGFDVATVLKQVADVGVAKAVELVRGEKDLCRLEASMEPFTGEAGLDLDALYGSNLISGVAGNEE